METKRETTVYSMMSESDSDCLITHFRGGVQSDDDCIIVSCWNKET